MTRRLSFGMLAGALLVLSACGSDEGATDASVTVAPAPETSAAASGITIEGAWARNSPMMATAGAAYMTITSSTADKLVGASVDASIAAVVEIHETRMVDGGMGTDTTMMMGGDTTMPGMGAMEMVPVDSLDIPAGTAVELAPGGYHLMLLDLAAPLELGSTFTITLVFEQAGERPVEVVVADSAP